MRAAIQLSRMVLKSWNLVIIALNPSLPGGIRPGKCPLALCLTPRLLPYIRVGIWLSVELCKMELSGVEIAPIVPRKEHIGMHRVSTMRNGTAARGRKQAAVRVVHRGRRSPALT